MAVVLASLIALMMSLWVAFAGGARQAERPCREHPQLIAPCFTVHGRMRYYNGAPAIRIWPVGTDRLLGVSEGRFALSGYSNLPVWFRDTLDSNREIYADFVVCPFTRDEPGVMRLVCVDGASKIVTKPVPMW